ncbi:MAG: hypothetical protein JXA11_09195 [Phycisphaerae bacterium]|nr:hypothetical protein [Phycisphaerae bacterium]
MKGWNPDWPILKTYDQEHLSRVALPLGGIGTGTVSLGGRGQLQDWEIMNTPAKGQFLTSFINGRGLKPFFALYAKPADGPAVTRCLEGALPVEEYAGSAGGSAAANHGLPRFEECSFAAAYPFGQVLLRDRAVPVEVRLEAFNPLIPADADRSGIPAVILRYVLTNRTNRRLKASVCGFLANPIGKDTDQKNRCRFRRGKTVSGMYMDSLGVPETHLTWGTLALTTTARSGITCRTHDGYGRNWAQGNELLSFWDDFSRDGQLREHHRAVLCSRGFLSVSATIPPKGTKEITFLLTWRFPNRLTWAPKYKAKKCRGDFVPNPKDIIGNYYCTQYRDAWDVAEKTARDLKSLERDSLSFVRAFCESDLPTAVKDAALSNVSTLRTQTCFRTPDGTFFGWEGCNDDRGSCLGSCTHVWNYEQATAFLFGELAMTMRDVEFAHATDKNGKMSFRTNLPLDRAKEYPNTAADGQMGCIMKMYRDWQFSGDDKTLKRLWPSVRKALEFCWIPGGWDADRDGVMEGCQHNTMDVEYYGPNPLMTSLYLGALRAAEEMARYLGETDFADACRALFAKGSRWMDENLFNGEYYEHHVQPMREKNIAKYMRHEYGAENLKDPDFQLGSGCAADQLLGQTMAHICGLGYLHDKRKVRETLRSILKYNHRDDLSDHFNCMRTYALGKERGLLLAAYPDPARKPARPTPYFSEVWTGIEYVAATGMIQEGMETQGVRVFADVRDRHDGKKRNPFNEPECGHHYARAMASWAAVVAIPGFQYSAVEKSMEFAAREGEHFWSNGYAWGTCRIRKIRNACDVELTVLHGEVKLKRFILKNAGETVFSPMIRLQPGKQKRMKIPV